MRCRADNVWPVWCLRPCRIIGNVVKFRNVPNAVRWTGLQLPLAQGAGKAQARKKPSQKTGQTKPERGMVNPQSVSMTGDP